MRTRTLILLTVLVVVVAACGDNGSEGTSTTSAADTTTTADAPEAMLLSYSLEAGQSISYEAVMDQHIQLAVEGDPTALGEAEAAGEDFPQQMDLNITGTTTFTHSVADGPEPGTYAITITGDLSGLEFSGTIDGEPVSDADTDLPDMAGMEPVDVTIVVDEQGNIIPDESGLPEDFFGGLGGMDMLSDIGPGAGAGTGQFFGPPFTEEEVTVGDTWSETIEVPTMPGDDPITTTVESAVTGTEDIDGVETFVIETTSSTSAVEFDLADILIGFMTAFVPEDASDEDLSEIEALSEQLRFAFTVDPQIAAMTTWFDGAAGVSRQARVVSSTHMTMDINVPDDESGEMVEMAMDMSIDQDTTYHLLEVGDGGDA
ncbi:MAG: hypothetical protein WAL25_13070 [Acidimicrobiia bacterium]